MFMLNQILTRDLRKLINSNEFKINNLSTYSTKEKIIGIWYNGKTLYRKTFYISKWSTFNHNINNVDEIMINLGHSFRHHASGNNVGINTGTDSNGMVNATQVILNGQVTPDYAIIVLEYTKTTDRA